MLRLQNQISLLLWNRPPSPVPVWFGFSLVPVLVGAAAPWGLVHMRDQTLWWFAKRPPSSASSALSSLRLGTPFSRTTLQHGPEAALYPPSCVWETQRCEPLADNIFIMSSEKVRRSETKCYLKTPVHNSLIIICASIHLLPVQDLKATAHTSARLPFSGPVSVRTGSLCFTNRRVRAVMRQRWSSLGGQQCSPQVSSLAISALIKWPVL